ncbi:MAG: DUF5716 family protein [Faecalimonas sp.]|nr:DUF5716 family protein [Faecalimonas sp.]
MTGYIIGYDLNETYCQISFYNEEQQEPQTMETTQDHYQIPLIIGKKDGKWLLGAEARRLFEEGLAVEDLYNKSLKREKLRLGEESYEAIWLLAKFVELSLKGFSNIEQLVFTVPHADMDIVKVLKSIGSRAGVSKQGISVQDYKESFCNYMLYQPKELWQYEAALFHCDRHEVKAYMLRKIHAGSGKGRDAFVTVDEVAHAQMQELEMIYPVLNVDRAKDADAAFRQFIQGVFAKKIVSSVFLVGEGFENEWFPQSLKVLCNGRRAFFGNNLYSKGACYTAYRRCFGKSEGPIYLDESKMMDQICLKVRTNGMDKWQPIVSWGSRWFEADTQFEILLEDAEDIELHVESLVGNEMQVEKISLAEFPKRKDYSLRLQVKILFLDEKTCFITFQDIGFGEFFRATGACVEREIHLGGNHGQYHSLS